MFTKIYPAIAQHTEGYTVRFTGRFGVEYASGDMVATIEVEHGGPTVAIYPHTMKFLRGGEPTTMSEAQQTEILERTLAGLRFIGAVPEIVPEPIPTERQVYRREQLLADGELIQRSIKPSRFGPGFEDGTNPVQ